MEIEIALYMMPVPISEASWNDVIPSGNVMIIRKVRHYIVEKVKTARRFLKKMCPEIDINSLHFHELNAHTPENEISGFLQALRDGEPMALMSEAGCPGVADPGAKVVAIAQSENMKVIPLVGPSSILLALMASGLNGQKFTFNGYLPIDSSLRDKTIKELESESRRKDETQIFIETPYRNNRMLEALLKNLAGETLLCVASDITSPDTEKIKTMPVKEWKKLKTGK